MMPHTATDPTFSRGWFDAATDLDCVVRARRVVTPTGIRPAAILIRDGVIVGVEPAESPVTADLDVDYPPEVAVLPGLVDTHVHLQDPGPHAWEGFDSGTAAAAAGGITTLVDMPVDSTPATTDVEALDLKRASARGRLHVDVGFWGGVIPANLGALESLWAAGVFGFKAYLSDPGPAQFPPLDDDQLAAALSETARLRAVLAVHAERAGPAPQPGGAPSGADRRVLRYADLLAARPVDLEESAVAAVIEAVRSTGGRAHIVHVASAGAAALLADARRAGLDVSAETCPHHLTLIAEQIPDGATHALASPPLRGAANREALWKRLWDGTFAMVVSDHSPFDPVRKHADDGDFARAAGGIVSLQIALPVVWTQARARGFTLVDVARWMSGAPALRLGLGGPGVRGLEPGRDGGSSLGLAGPGVPAWGWGKGAIAVGHDADLCVLEPERAFVVDPAELWHRQRQTPYDGHRLTGVVRETWLRGRPVTFTERRGNLLTRPDLLTRTDMAAL